MANQLKLIEQASFFDFTLSLVLSAAGLANNSAEKWTKHVIS
jgi:hypothetical protein